jgi:phosphoglycerate kinase
MGKYEDLKFRNGTMAIARDISFVSRGKTYGVIGGGETVDAVSKSGVKENIDWVSTGGGAMISFLSGENIPGLQGIVN